MRKSFSIAFILVCILSCNTTKNLQNRYRFSDACRETYELFSNLIARQNTDLLTVKAPVKENYLRLLKSYEANVKCWNSTIPEVAIIELFGVPHKREVGSRTQSTTIRYYIRTKDCIYYGGTPSSDEGCGVLEFTFSKEGKPTGSVFYAINPT